MIATKIFILHFEKKKALFLMSKCLETFRVWNTSSMSRITWFLSTVKNINFWSKKFVHNQKVLLIISWGLLDAQSARTHFDMTNFCAETSLQEEVSCWEIHLNFEVLKNRSFWHIQISQCTDIAMTFKNRSFWGIEHQSNHAL